MNPRIVMAIALPLISAAAGGGVWLWQRARRKRSSLTGRWFETARVTDQPLRSARPTAIDIEQGEDGRLHVWWRTGHGDHLRVRPGVIDVDGPVPMLAMGDDEDGPLEVVRDKDDLVVVEPDRSTAHILTRSPSMHDEVLRGLVNRLQALGLDPDKLIRVGEGRLPPDGALSPPAPRPEEGPAAALQDRVDQALVDSFPASDPPAYNPGTA